MLLLDLGFIQRCWRGINNWVECVWSIRRRIPGASQREAGLFCLFDLFDFFFFLWKEFPGIFWKDFWQDFLEGFLAG